MASTPSKAALWTGRILSGLVILFLLADGAAKVAMVEAVKETCLKLEIPLRVVPGLGVVLMLCTIIYAIPQTSILGAILLTGYLGGAEWTHVRMGGPVFPMVFPVVFGAIVWIGLYLREPRLRALTPLKSKPLDKF